MTLARFTLVAAIALGGLFAAGAAQAGSARADGDIAVRSGPGSSYRVVDRLEDGVSYEVVNCTSEARWCLVAEDGDRLGWVRGSRLIGAAAKIMASPFEPLVNKPPFPFP